MPAAGRRPRTLYSNDSRHYHLFVHEPPMTLADARRPVDDVAGTAVDTFVFMVARGDGLFYPSKVGGMFGSDATNRNADGDFEMAAYFRAYHNMAAMVEQGLDPLTVLIDRAHEKGMDFIASLRLTAYLTPEGVHVPGEDGALAVPETRDHMLVPLPTGNLCHLKTTVSPFDFEEVCRRCCVSSPLTTPRTASSSTSPPLPAAAPWPSAPTR